MAQLRNRFVARSRAFTGSAGWRRKIMVAAALGTALAACAGKSEPAAGELMVALVTDMSIPKDVSTIHIEILVNGLLTYKYDYPIAPDGTYHLPGTLAVVAGSKPSPTVEVQVAGIRIKKDLSSEARVFGRVATTVPR